MKSVPLFCLVGSAACGRSTRGLLELTADKIQQLDVVVADLRAGMGALQKQHDSLAASAKAEKGRLETWEAETLRKLLSASSVPGRQTRHLSADACARRELQGPQLLVEGACSCTGGVVVNGRNLTSVLDALLERSTTSTSTTTSTTTTSTTTSSTTTTATTTTCPPTAMVGSVTAAALDAASAVAVSPSGRYAYVAAAASDSIAVVDVGSDPANPVVVGSVTDSTLMDGARTVAVEPTGRYVYVAAFLAHNVAVVDVGTDPTNPTVVGSVQGIRSDLSNAAGLALSPDGRFAYVTGAGSFSIVVLDIATDRENPTVVGSIAGNSADLKRPYQLAVADDGIRCGHGSKQSDRRGHFHGRQFKHAATNGCCNLAGRHLGICYRSIVQ
eukprot:INCI19189.1.p1 GENE.INCI19189.1~~INCI19189.1.p1  ORF type:complete len:386 (-),score=69.55 INCI19189.1:271-1428(-)